MLSALRASGSSPHFPNLLQPGQIGSMMLRNRMVMSPMETMYGTSEGLPSERTRHYFAARATGGVGLITVGATGIDHHHPETPGGLHLGTDAAVAAHRALVDVVHEQGAKIQPQIVHAGPDGLGPEMHGVTSIGPSVIPSYLTGRPSAEVTHEQLIEVFDLFKAAVRRAAEAGYDGIELHAAHGYMFLGSFLAPQRNRRTDDYRGDSVRGRVRVVLKTLAAIRSEIGGALLWASILHPENEPFLRWLRDEVGRSSMKIGLGHEVSADDVVDLHPDAVVVANGGQVVLPSIPGSDLPHVQTGQALRDRFGGWRQRLVRPKAVRAAAKAWMPMGHRVVIVGADLAALELAEFLAARGRLVSVLEADKTIAPELGNKRKTEHMDRLDRLGVSVHVRAPVDEIVPDGVVFTPYGGTSRLLAADSVVIAGTLAPNTELHEKLVAALPNAAVHAAGDCTGLGLIRKATEDGARAACAI